MAEAAEGHAYGRRPAKRSPEASRDERTAVREELPARGTQARDDVSVPEHGEHDSTRREPLHHVAGISDRELEEARAARPADAQRPDYEATCDLPRHVRHHQHADPQANGDAPAACSSGS